MNKTIKDEKLENDTQELEEQASEKKTKNTEQNRKTAEKKKTALSEEAHKIKELESSVKELTEKLLLSEDKVLRLHAEFENFRKRSIREKNDARVNSQFNTVTAILPVMDHFELALNSAEQSDNFAALLEGMKLIKDEFNRALKSLGIESINALGQEFDPNIHEAIAHEPSDELDKDIVSKQWRVGYKLGDRLIRPATVVVSAGKSEIAE